jgi:hypothetical protein
MRWTYVTYLRLAPVETQRTDLARCDITRMPCLSSRASDGPCTPAVFWSSYSQGDDTKVSKIMSRSENPPRQFFARREANETPELQFSSSTRIYPKGKPWARSESLAKGPRVQRSFIIPRLWGMNDLSNSLSSPVSIRLPHCNLTPAFLLSSVGTNKRLD